MSEKIVDCANCHFSRFGPCTCEGETAAGCTPTPLTEQDKREIRERHTPRVVSYFLFKPSVRIPKVCYNANSACCKDCQEPECDLCGWTSNSNNMQSPETPCPTSDISLPDEVLPEVCEVGARERDNSASKNQKQIKGDSHE